MTGIMELLQADGIQVKKETTKEYSSPCPKCGGKDRFRIFPTEGGTGRAWCRQCDLKVDGIGYLMDVHGLAFQEAAEYVGKAFCSSIRKNDKKNTPVLRVESPVCPQRLMVTGEPEENGEPSPLWREKAENFIDWAADNLRKNTERIEQLYRERGISPETAERWRLGWNPSPLKRPATKWGIEGVELFFPTGLVVPNIRGGKPVSVKIRKDSGEPKYHHVRGSKVFPYLLPGDVQGTVALVEAEFDALLLWETARDVVFPVALGGCANKPDIDTLELITKAEILINCMDNDLAGDSAGKWWNDWFPRCFRWKPTRKDPGEMYKAGESVRQWIFDGIRASLRDKGLCPGKLDFYEALDNLAEPFPPELLQELTEEQIERAAIMAESGISTEIAIKYAKEAQLH